MFEEDVVEITLSKKSNGEQKRKLGVVLESSQYISSDEEDDDDSFYKAVRKNTVRVAWHPNGKTEVIEEDKLKLVDRSLVPGDLVRRLIKGQETQKGYVFKTQIKCVLRCLNQPFIIPNVESSLLSPFLKFNKNSHDVYMDDWVGVVKKVTERIVVKFQDGARCELNSEEIINSLDEFDDLNDKRDKDTEFVTSSCYVGQVLKGPFNTFQNAKWIQSTKNFCQKTAQKSKSREVVVVVDEFDVQTVEVFWLCCGYSDIKSNKDISNHPPTIVKGEDLKRLKPVDCFAASNFQIGDVAYYVLDANDDIISLENCKNKDTIIENCILKSRERSKNSDKQMICDRSSRASTDSNYIINMEDIVVVGDGNVEPRVHSLADDPNEDQEVGQDKQVEHNKLVTPNSSNTRKHKHHKPPNSNRNQKKKKVFLKKSKPKKFYEQVKKFEAGDRIPIEILSTFTIVDVMWQDGVLEENIPSTSLFPIHHLDELEFFPGDFVVHSQSTEGNSPTNYGVVQEVNFAARTCVVRWFNLNEGKDHIDKDVSVFDLKEHEDLKVRPGMVVVRVGGFSGNKLERVSSTLSSSSSHHDPPTVGGQILELCLDGRLLIQWADESTSFCKPVELFFVGSDMSDMEESDDDEYDFESDDESSKSSESCQWETEEEIEVDASDASRDKLHHHGNHKPDKLGSLKDSEAMNRNYEFLVSSEKVLKRYSKSLDDVLECIDRYLNNKKSARLEEDCLVDSTWNDTSTTKPTTSSNLLIMTSSSSSTSNSYTSTTAALISAATTSLTSTATVTTSTATVTTSTTSTTSKPTTNVQQMMTEISSTSLEQCLLEKNGDTSHASKQYVKMHDDFTISVDTFLAVVLEMHSLYKALCRLDHMKKINCLPRMKKYIELANEKIRNERISSWSTKATFKAKCLFEMNCKRENKMEDCTMEVCESTKEDARDETAAESFADCSSQSPPPVHSLVNTKDGMNQVPTRLDLYSSLHMEREQSTYDFINEFRSFLLELIKEFDCWVEYYRELLHKKNEVSDDVLSTSNNGTEDDLSHIDLIKLLLDVDKSSEMYEDAEKEVDSIAEEEFFSCPSTDLSPLTPVEVKMKVEFNERGFSMLSCTPEHHHFLSTSHNPTNPKNFLTAVKKEINLLKTSLPKGIFVKGYDSRMDLFSVMIQGPTHTPYEDGLFFFDIRLTSDYPKNPPKFFYVSYCSDRLNPNLYEDGKVCVSLLGTWSGKGTEVWNPKESNLLQVLVSIQGLILNQEPYFNEAGYERQKGTQEGQENSRMYNEMVLIKLVQAMTKLLSRPHSAFLEEIEDHFHEHAPKFINKLKSWLQSSMISDKSEDTGNNVHEPEFPLYPISKGFQLSLTKCLNEFVSLAVSKNIITNN